MKWKAEILCIFSNFRYFQGSLIFSLKTKPWSWMLNWHIYKNVFGNLSCLLYDSTNPKNLFLFISVDFENKTRKNQEYKALIFRILHFFKVFLIFPRTKKDQTNWMTIHYFYNEWFTEDHGLILFCL